MRAGSSRKATTALFLALVLPASLLAQEPRVTTRVDTTELTVGDRITYSLTVEHPTGSEVVWPDSLSLAPFEILDARVLPPAAQTESEVTSLRLTLTVFELGDLELPSIPLEVVSADGSVSTLLTNPYGIRVNSVGLDEGDDIRDVKGPRGIPLDFGRILLILLATLLIPLAAYWVYRRLDRREVEEKEPPQVPSRPAHETALEALERLERSPLLERGEVKEFHIRVSDILRVYVEERFRVPALELTTRDLLQGMTKAGIDRTVRDGFSAFLEPCDMVKFAKAKPDPEASMATLRRGRKLVEDTIPQVSVELESEPAAVSIEEPEAAGQGATS